MEIGNCRQNREKLLFLVPFAAFGSLLFERITADGADMALSEALLLERLHAFTRSPETRVLSFLLATILSSRSHGA